MTLIDTIQQETKATVLIIEHRLGTFFANQLIELLS